MICQIPGGLLLDRFGSRIIITGAFLGMGILNFLQGTVTFFTGIWVISALFLLRGLIAFMETPGIPAFTRLVTTWFPLKEKGLAMSATGASQYIAAVLFVPLFAWFAGEFNFQSLFILIGILELIVAAVFYRLTPPPTEHPKVNAAEVAYIRDGGGLPDIDSKKKY